MSLGSPDICERHKSKKVGDRCIKHLSVVSNKLELLCDFDVKLTIICTDFSVCLINSCG